MAKVIWTRPQCIPDPNAFDPNAFDPNAFREQVYREAFRVLKPGGRLAISDVVAIKPVPKTVRENLDKHSGCVAGALQVRKLEAILQAAGFQNGRVVVKEASREFIKDWFPRSGLEHYVRSADVQGDKPVKAGVR